MNSAIEGTTSRITYAFQWLRIRLFSSWFNAFVTLGILYLGWILVQPLVQWAFIRAVWSPVNASLCRDAIHHGACWAFVADKYRFILFGTFPFDQHWRPALTITILIGLYALSAVRFIRGSRLVSVWLTGLVAIGVLIWGGVFGLRYVENERWGGLTLMLLLATFGIGLRFRLRYCWRSGVDQTCRWFVGSLSSTSSWSAGSH